MRVKTPPLLCELHAHSTWSDGRLTLTELVDLYGGSGFDVLVVTDHALRSDDPWPAENPGGSWIDAGNHAAYLDAITREAVRARARFGLLVVPGLELTYNDPDPDAAGHAVAVGLRSYVSPDSGLAEAMALARGAGAAIIAAHPHGDVASAIPERTTRWFWHQWRFVGGLVDRYELFNRNEVFGWVADEALPTVASGDFHRLEHLTTWKTLLPCERSEAAVVDYLRSSRPAYITQLGRPVRADRVAA
jgi:hypothetical protein